MSWTDTFPVLTDELVAEYAQKATPADEAMFAEWFSVSRTIQPRTGKHVVATSLFWKNLESNEGELPPITREMMMNAKELGLVSRHVPWDHYVQPLLDGATTMQAARPDVVFRVYLAADLEFLVPDLVAVGCEVKLMASSSIRHNPGALWRFLAFEEQDCWVTITDSDLAREILSSVERTELIMQSGLGLWRVPYIFGSVRNNNNPGDYRPINASQWGGIGGYPMELLMKAFIWHTLRGTMPNQCTIGPKRKNRLDIYGTDWPTYGFDEWFLTAAMYPRMAFSGVMTFHYINQREVNHWFALDIEYVTWASPKSEILYFGKSNLLKRKRRGKMIKPPRSRILEGMLAKKVRISNEPIEFSRSRDQIPLTLVVARYNEDLNWLLEVPEDVKIVVYNKGTSLTGEAFLERIDQLISLPNEGRESDTYLHHIEMFDHGPADSMTAFCQGDPFTHSPDFLKLLDVRDQWAEVQGLTAGYMESMNIPPRYQTVLDDGEWLSGLPVRTEICSVHTLDILGWRDDAGARFFRDYREYYQMDKGWNITAHFLEQCGLRDLAAQAWQATLARFVYGAMFAVRNERLRMIPKSSLPKMRRLARGEYFNGFVLERMWLHFFGLPFISVEKQQVTERCLNSSVSVE